MPKMRDQIIGQIKQQLNIYIEFASPGDFIPLPQTFLARYQAIRPHLLP